MFTTFNVRNRKMSPINAGFFWSLIKKSAKHEKRSFIMATARRMVWFLVNRKHANLISLETDILKAAISIAVKAAAMDQTFLLFRLENPWINRYFKPEEKQTRIPQEDYLEADEIELQPIHKRKAEAFEIIEESCSIPLSKKKTAILSLVCWAETMKSGKDCTATNSRLFTVCPNNSGNMENAKDIFQDTMVIFIEKVFRNDFNLRYNVGSYLFSSQNCCGLNTSGK